jgi:drug/metabolite transporter (DMT)-like permease
MQTTPIASARQTKGYAISLVGTALWSTSAILIRHLTDHYRMQPLVLAFWRDLLVAATLVLVLGLVQVRLLHLTRRQVGFFMLYGLVMMFFSAAWTISVALNGAAISTLLAYSSPAFTALFAWKIWRETLGPFKIVAVLLSIAGCIFVSGAYSYELWSLNPTGIVIGLASGLMFSGYSIFGKEASHRGIDPWTTLTYAFAFAAVFLFVALQLPLEGWIPALSGIGGRRDLFWLGGDVRSWGNLLALVWVPTIGGYGLYNVSLTYLPASVASLITSLEPSMTAVLAYMFLGERLSAAQIVGSVMVLVGVVMLRLDSRDNQQDTFPA